MAYAAKRGGTIIYCCWACGCRQRPFFSTVLGMPAAEGPEAAAPHSVHRGSCPALCTVLPPALYLYIFSAHVCGVRARQDRAIDHWRAACLGVCACCRERVAQLCYVQF